MTVFFSIRRALPAILFGMCCCTAIAAEPPAQTSTQSNTAGMKVGIDPKTGELRPLTTAESEKLDRAAAPAAAKSNRASPAGRSFSAPANAAASRTTVRRGVGSTVSVKLPQDQMTTLRAERDADGELQISEQAGAQSETHAAQPGGKP